MSLSYKNEDSDTSHGDSIDNNSKSAIGVPVYFYFKINTAKLVNRTQLSNLKEIAEIAKEKNVIVKITGAADSATGSEQTNRRLEHRKSEVYRETVNEVWRRKVETQGFVPRWNR